VHRTPEHANSIETSKCVYSTNLRYSWEQMLSLEWYFFLERRGKWIEGTWLTLTLFLIFYFFKKDMK
jgi:hypothetical protein